MKTKRKLIIAVSALISSVIIAVIAVVAIFAAQNQSVQSNLTVRYTAVDVSATVRANHIVGTVSTPMLTDEGKEELVFLPKSVEGGSLTPQDETIELSTQDNSVVFEYIFRNDSNSVDVKIDLDVTGFSVNNMSLEYAYSYSKITDVINMPTTTRFEPMMILGNGKENGNYQTLYVYVKAKISNLANDAYFEGNMDFSLTRATPVKLTFENVTNATNKVLLQTRYIPANTNINSFPLPTFIDGKIYGWFNESSLETMVNYPFIASDDLTIYAGIAPYLATMSEDGIVTTIENLTEDEIYLTTGTNTSFAFGARNYSNTDGAYILLEAGQIVNIFNDSGTNNVNFASPVSASNAVKSVSLDKPSNLEIKKFYSAYGMYPQTYVGEELNTELKTKKLTETGKSYTTDINGETANLIEYSYKGQLYAKLESSLYSGSNVYFSIGEKVVNSQMYFFHVEPIVAKAMQKNIDGTYTMMSIDILGSRMFDESSNEWIYSEIRSFLNNSFLNESGLNDVVVEQSVKNNTTNSFSDGSGVNTTDKIRIASVEEILIWSGSGYTSNAEDLLKSSSGSYTDSYNSSRRIKQSDLACATHSNYSSGYGRYYLRSSGNANGKVCRINSGGNIYSAHGCTTADSGYCPVFAVSL